MHKGQHLLIDCREVGRNLCLDDQRLLESMARAAAACGATVISQIRYRFGSDSPPGCTAIVMLDESHCSAHTYADLGLIAFDFFTCGNTDPSDIWERIRTELSLDQVSVRKVYRFQEAASGEDPGSQYQTPTSSAQLIGGEPAWQRVISA